MAVIEPGQKAPAFSLPDQDGVVHRLKDYADRPLILYFYPKDDTPGCTKEACAFRDHQPAFQAHQDGGPRRQCPRHREQGQVRQEARPQLHAPRGCRARGGGPVRRVEEEEHVRQDLHGRGADDVPDRPGRQGGAAVGRRQGGRPRRGRARRRARSLSTLPGRGPRRPRPWYSFSRARLAQHHVRTTPHRRIVWRSRSEIGCPKGH